MFIIAQFNIKHIIHLENHILLECIAHEDKKATI